jgi:hypothetical protein
LVWTKDSDDEQMIKRTLSNLEQGTSCQALDELRDCITMANNGHAFSGVSAQNIGLHLRRVLELLLGNVAPRCRAGLNRVAQWCFADPHMQGSVANARNSF